MIPIVLTVRDLQPEDLADLDWSGGPEHVNAVAEALGAAYRGDVAVLVIALPNGRLVANGAVDFARCLGAGSIGMLAVHETFQDLGLGTMLIGALEDRIRERGLQRSRLNVEQDNPPAARLYRRLGYREVGSVLESWPVSDDRTYVTVSSVLERRLGPTQPVDCAG